MSAGETLMRPTAMLYRNLMSMTVAETIRANPIDGVVLLSGCDKTTPAMLMGAASVDIPTLLISGGPMLTGRFRGAEIGIESFWNFADDVRAGKMTEDEYLEAEGCMARSAGHCMVMGTASTMACMAEALGLQLPGSAAIPAVDSRRYAQAQVAGQRVVEMVREGLTISKVVTRASFENAIVVNAALGGSTNAVVHLLALAGRLGVELCLEDFNDLARDIPVLANVHPSGTFRMEDFFYAGGLPAVMAELGDLLNTDALTVTGATVGDNVAGAPNWNREVITTRGEPFQAPGKGTVVLRGNLCPNGAVLKLSAASPELLLHTGPALVFDRIEDYNAVVDDPDLPVDASTVLVVRNAGPRGYPGFPEVGNMQIPKKLLQAGVHDMVRVSDARMSGTGFGTCVLHVAPEAAVGGPLALVRTGDLIRLDASTRTLDLLVDDAEMATRQKTIEVEMPKVDRGYAQLYVDHVLQADTGCDFDFLVGRTPHTHLRHSH